MRMHKERDTSTLTPDVIEFGPRTGWRLLDFRELWQYRQLLGVLGLRDLKVRYRQTIIGVLWAVPAAGRHHGGVHPPVQADGARAVVGQSGLFDHAVRRAAALANVRHEPDAIGQQPGGEPEHH